MQRIITRGASGNSGLIFHVFAQDSASTIGAGKASVAYSSWACRYIRSGEAISGAITPEDISTIGTYASPTANTNIRIKAVDNTNMIGVYEIQIHADWVNATNSCQSLTIYLTATGVAVLPIQIPLVAYNGQDSVRLGLTALPNAAAEASGGLFTRGTGAGQINQAANGTIDANTVALGGTSQTARDIGASVLISSGSGAGQVLLSSGTVTVGTNNDKTGYTASTVSDKTGYSLSSSQTFDVTGNITGNLSGSVGSVTAAVNISASAVQSIWDALTSALTTAGSIGKKLADWVIGVTQTGDSYARLGAPSGASVSADIAALPTATEIATQVIDTSTIESTLTLKQTIRLILSALAGKLTYNSGSGTVTIRDITDSKDRIVADVDGSGNRTSITIDVS
jgi:hypothetical protein